MLDSGHSEDLDRVRWIDPNEKGPTASGRALIRLPDHSAEHPIRYAQPVKP